MLKFSEVEKTFFSETNSLSGLNFPNFISSITTIELGQIFVSNSRDESSFILNGVVNWSAAFAPFPVPIMAASPGFATVSFEILKDGEEVYRVIDTLGQPNFDFTQIPGQTASTSLSTGFKTTKLDHVETDVSPIIKCRVNFFTLRASIISLVPPMTETFTPAGTVSVSFGPTALIAQKAERSR